MSRNGARRRIGWRDPRRPAAGSRPWCRKPWPGHEPRPASSHASGPHDIELVHPVERLDLQTQGHADLSLELVQDRRLGLEQALDHIRVRKDVPREIAETWRWMCPAGVYEIPEDAPEHGNVDLIVNYTNCVQCGAITAKGGRLTTPEGGDGPLYQLT